MCLVKSKQASRLLSDSVKCLEGSFKIQRESPLKLIGETRVAHVQRQDNGCEIKGRREREVYDAPLIVELREPGRFACAARVQRR